MKSNMHRAGAVGLDNDDEFASLTNAQKMRAVIAIGTAAAVALRASLAARESAGATRLRLAAATARFVGRSAARYAANRSYVVLASAYALGAAGVAARASRSASAVSALAAARCGGMLARGAAQRVG
jgi:hypothetical protein